MLWITSFSLDILIKRNGRPAYHLSTYYNSSSLCGLHVKLNSYIITSHSQIVSLKAFVRISIQQKTTNDDDANNLLFSICTLATARSHSHTEHTQTHRNRNWIMNAMWRTSDRGTTITLTNTHSRCATNLSIFLSPLWSLSSSFFTDCLTMNDFTQYQTMSIACNFMRNEKQNKRKTNRFSPLLACVCVSSFGRSKKHTTNTVHHSQLTIMVCRTPVPRVYSMQYCVRHFKMEKFCVSLNNNTLVPRDHLNFAQKPIVLHLCIDLFLSERVNMWTYLAIWTVSGADLWQLEKRISLM